MDMNAHLNDSDSSWAYAVNGEAPFGEAPGQRTKLWGRKIRAHGRTGTDTDGHGRVRRLAACDTAGWQPALRGLLGRVG